MQMSYVPPIPDAARNGTGQLVLEKVHPLEFSDAIEGFGNGSTEIVSGKIQDLQIPEQLDLGRNGPRQSVVGKPDFFHRPDVVSFVVANDPVPPALVDVLYADRVGLFVVQVVPGHKVVVHPPLPVLQKGDAARGAVECIVQCQQGKALEELLVEHQAVSVPFSRAGLRLVGQPLDGHEIGREGIPLKVHLVVLKEFHQRTDVVRGGLRCR
mmetsp:Transcript_8185/g.19608  ORF Transcript_8185/g.19608 Transcript_8185/m.19608 type:complete len:211 (-) Transcript_8185:117-749(-)